MDNATGNSSLERLILIAGLTGVGLRQVYQWLLDNAEEMDGLKRECIVHFEDRLLSRMPRSCVGIEQVAGLIPVSRDAGRNLFESTASEIIRHLASNECRISVVFIHLSYLSHGTVITNPALGRLLNSAHSLNIVYLIDDFYDALERIQRRLDEGMARTGRAGLIGSPFTIDPIGYLMWRAIDYNLITALETFKPGTRTFLLGVKHPLETFKRLMASLISNSGTRYIYTYVSHTITAPRKLYSHGFTESLRDNPVVLAIEALKEALIEVDKCLVLFEPTTVDELLSDNAKYLLSTLKVCSQPESSQLCDEEDHDVEDSQGSSCLCTLKYMVCGNDQQCFQHIDDIVSMATVNHSLIVTWRNRWPLHASTLYEDVSNYNVGATHDGGPTGPIYRYLYRGDNILNIIDSRFEYVYGGAEQYAEMISLIEFELLFPFYSRIRGAGEAPVLDKLLFQVKKQIEMRDYHYVSQATTIAVIMPLIVATPRDLWDLGVEQAQEAAGIYYIRSRGVEAEMQRAVALAKPIIVYVLPISVRALASSLSKNSGDEAQALEKAVKLLEDKSIFSLCQEIKDENHNLQDLLANCTRNLGGLFTPSSAGVRYCVIPYMLDEDDMTGDYYSSLGELKEKYRIALMEAHKSVSPNMCNIG
ncbi:MAG: hypothetical protein F7B18_06600 [Desulfurococcales archaeon]|nr:hypothetical protein [Desulfurococcales archaeon]